MADYVGLASVKFDDHVTSEAIDARPENPPSYTVRVRTPWSPAYIDIERDGYAVRLSQGEFDEYGSGWKYAALGTVQSDHFISATFGERHLFSMRVTDGLTIIRFCPRRFHGPGIQGELTVRPDTTLANVRLHFQIPREEKSPILFVQFYPPEQTFAYLRPSLTIFYYPRPIRDRFYRSIEEHRRWVVGARDAIDAMIKEWESNRDTESARPSNY